MSTRPPQTQKQKILSQMMWMVAAFLLAQLMCNKPAQPVDPRTLQQILGDFAHPELGAPPNVAVGQTRDASLGTMAWLSSNFYWSALQTQVNPVYQNKFQAEEDKKLKDKQADLKKGLASQAEVDALQKQIQDEEQVEKLRGDILIVDAEYKSAFSREDSSGIYNAFNTIAGDQRSLQGTPLWTQEFPIPAPAQRPERFAWQQISGKELYDKIVDDLSARNKTELTYGVFPGFKIIDALVNLTGAKPGFSYAFAAFLLAFCVRLLVFPLVQKQLMWGRKMQQLGPLIKEIKEQFTDKNGKVTDQAEMQKRTMALYAEYGINPLAGCLPAMVQFPLFITVYNFMRHYQFAFKKGTFLWINASTSAASHGFFAPDLGSRDYVLIVFYGITMIVSTLLMPVSDPTQIKQQRLMGVGMGLLFTFMMFTGAFPTPAAFVLYWVFTNLLATAQSLRAYRLPMPPLEKVNTKPGGVFPMPPFNDGGSGGIGKPNGKPVGPITAPRSTGTPAKHTPKKRK